MKRLKPEILIFALLASLTACVTEKHRQKICNTCQVISERRDSIVYKFDTVRVKIPGTPGPTLYIENPCAFFCDSLGRLRKNFDTSLVHGNSALNIRRIGNVIAIGAATTPTTAIAEVKGKEVYSKETSKVIQCPNERTSFDGFTNWYFYITAVLGGLYIVYKYFRWKYWRPPKA